MVAHDRAARKRLGRAVRAARVDLGFQNRADFAATVGRSSRQIQALENGEDGVGPDTLSAVASVLGWDPEDVYAQLEDASAGPREPLPTSLEAATDEELLDEVLRRIRGGARRDPAPLRMAARTVGRAPSGQTEEERAAELGISVVRPALRGGGGDAEVPKDHERGVTGGGSVG